MQPERRGPRDKRQVGPPPGGPAARLASPCRYPPLAINPAGRCLRAQPGLSSVWSTFFRPQAGPVIQTSVHQAASAGALGRSMTQPNCSGVTPPVYPRHKATNSWRATATMARFLPLLWARASNTRRQRAVVRTSRQAPSTSVQRNSGEPALVMIRRSKNDTVEVTIVARRGPFEAKFDEKEFDYVESYLDRAAFDEELRRVKEKIAGVGQDISKLSESTFPVLAKPAAAPRKPALKFRFLSSAKEIIPDANGRIQKLVLTENQLVAKGEGTAASNSIAFSASAAGSRCNSALTSSKTALRTLLCLSSRFSNWPPCCESLVNSRIKSLAFSWLNTG